MSDNTDLDLAFPFVSQGGIHEHHVFSTGMTKREYAAILIMAALATDSREPVFSLENTAERAVSWADSLLAELNKDKQ